MEETTDTIHYTYYYYQLPNGEVFNGEMTDFVPWLHDHQGDASGSGAAASSHYDINDHDVVYHSSSHERGFVHSANIGMIITGLSIAVNLFLIFVVLTKRSLRRQLVYQQIVNVSLSDLAFSVTVDPFMVYYDLQPWQLASAYCVALNLLDAALPFVSFLALICLNVDRLLFALNPSTYRYVVSRAVVKVAVLVLPWVVGLGLMLPLWLLSAVMWPQPGMCVYGITKKAAVASSCLSLFLPCVLLVVLTVLVLITTIGGMPHTPDNSCPTPFPLPALPPTAPPSLPISLPPSSPAPDATAPPAVVRKGEAAPASTPATFNRTHTQVVLLCQEGLLSQTRPTSVNLTRVNSQESTASGGRGVDAESPEVRKTHRSLVIAVCMLNMLTVITQLPYGAISLLEPQCVESECQSTIKLLQALGWLRSLTFSLHSLVLVLLVDVRSACCSLCRSVGVCRKSCGLGRRSSDSHEGGLALARGVTTSGVTKSENIELTSVNGPRLHTQEKGSFAML